MPDKSFVRWLDELEHRYLSDLNFSEVRRAVQALSSLYVERRDRVDFASAFGGSGKRAAFAMYFGPLHFLLITEIVRALHARVPKDTDILDLGCGTGVAGAAWALELQSEPKVIGVDRNPWALQECKWTYHQLGIHGLTRNAEIKTLRPPAHTAVIAAFVINELDSDSREHFREHFIKISRAGAPVLVVEPIARRISSWWDEWSQAWRAVGGRDDEWRFRITLPERLALMDRAAGLNHRELTGRSLWLPASA